jgi:hypothetical protein
MKARACVIQYSELSDKSQILTVKDSEKYLYIHHTYSPYDKDNRRKFFSLYDKQTRQLTANIKTVIQNDWDGGMDIENFHAYFFRQIGHVFFHTTFRDAEKADGFPFCKSDGKVSGKEKSVADACQKPA